MTHVSFAIVGVHTVILLFLMIFSCQPIQKSWDLTVPATDGYCVDVVALYFATAIANILTDVILIVIPIPLLIGLNMPRGEKIGVLIVFIFASGYVASQHQIQVHPSCRREFCSTYLYIDTCRTLVTSVVRCAFLPSLLANPDETWVISQASICASVTILISRSDFHICLVRPTMPLFTQGSQVTDTTIPSSIIEANLVIICASTTTLRRFLCHVAPRIMSYASGAVSVPGSENAHNLHLASLSRGKPMRRASRHVALDDGQELFSHNIQTETNVQAGYQLSDVDSVDFVDTAHESTGNKGILQTKTVSVSWKNDVSSAV